MTSCAKCEMERRQPGTALCVGGPLHGQVRRIDGTKFRATVRLPDEPVAFRSMGDLSPVELPKVGAVEYEFMLLKDAIPVYVVGDMVRAYPVHVCTRYSYMDCEACTIEAARRAAEEGDGA